MAKLFNERILTPNDDDLPWFAGYNCKMLAKHGSQKQDGFNAMRVFIVGLQNGSTPAQWSSVLPEVKKSISPEHYDRLVVMWGIDSPGKVATEVGSEIQAKEQPEAKKTESETEIQDKVSEMKVGVAMVAAGIEDGHTEKKAKPTEMVAAENPSKTALEAGAAKAAVKVAKKANVEIPASDFLEKTQEVVKKANVEVPLPGEAKDKKAKQPLNVPKDDPVKAAKNDVGEATKEEANNKENVVETVVNVMNKAAKEANKAAKEANI
uniref:Uncharacterized protein n=1 Tax=Lotharella oceanica TaxID=641309 RepID=A0A7S2TI92_9EUKA